MVFSIVKPCFISWNKEDLLKPLFFHHIISKWLSEINKLVAGKVVKFDNPIQDCFLLYVSLLFPVSLKLLFYSVFSID